MARFRTYRELRERIDYLEANREVLRKYGPWYPRPPVPGSEHIRPVTHRNALLQEGRIQKNCVVARQQSVMDGKTYVYRVLRPERATLEIARCYDGSWAVKELRASCNREVNRVTRLAVEKWLSLHRPGL